MDVKKICFKKGKICDEMKQKGNFTNTTSYLVENEEFKMQGVCSAKRQMIKRSKKSGFAEGVSRAVCLPRELELATGKQT